MPFSSLKLSPSCPPLGRFPINGGKERRHGRGRAACRKAARIADGADQRPQGQRPSHHAKIDAAVEHPHGKSPPEERDRLGNQGADGRKGEGHSHAQYYGTCRERQ